MSNLTPVPSFDSVLRLETSTPGQAGPVGLLTLQAQQLANRTEFLKDQTDAHTAVIGNSGLPADARAKLGLGDLVVGYTARGSWSTATAYVLNDVVVQSSVAYQCTLAHTSGTFATDRAAGKWAVYQGLRAADLSAAGGAALVGYGASTVQDVLDAVSTDFRIPFLSAGNAPRDLNNSTGDGPHLFEVTNDNTAYQCLRFNSYGATTNGNNVHWCRYFNTSSSPAAIGSGAYFMSMGFRGWDGTGDLSQSMAAFQVLTTEAWTPGAHGIKFNFDVCKTGGTTRHAALQIYAGATDGAVLQVGDGSALFSRILNSSMTGALQLHGSSDQAGAQSVFYGSAHSTQPGANLNRAVRTLWEGLGGTEFARLTADGLSIGTGTDATYRLDVKAATANAFRFAAADGAAMVYSTKGTNTFSAGESSAAAALYVRKDAGTNRSINCAGTVNASGADYAEWLPKAAGCGPLKPGQVVGINAAGQLTDLWAAAISFAVVSTAPSFVGNDVFEDSASAELVAFCGQVPCMWPGAAGEYIIPEPLGSGIGARGVATPTFEQYRLSVGRVIVGGEQPTIVVKVA